MAEFITKDLREAAFMWCQDGVKLTTMSNKGRSVYFHFETPFTEEEQTTLMISYANCDTTIEPNFLWEKHSMLRTRLENRLSRTDRR
jgi:hypothetical protein